MGKLVQKYNPYTNKFEMVPEDWVLRYNPFQNRHEFAPAGSGFSYLPTNGEFSAIPAPPKYNPHQETFSPGKRDWELVYNPLEGEFEIRPTKKDDPEW